MTPANNNAEENAKIALTWFFLKLLAGKLNEGYKLLQSYYFGGISCRYDHDLQDKGKDALKKIKQYFERGDVLVRYIRNNYAFHYSPPELNKILPNIPEDFEFYMEKEGSANNLYYFAELPSNWAILRNTGMADEFTTYKRLVEELPRLANWFSIFSDSFIYEFVNRYEKGFWGDLAEEVQFDKLPNMQDVHIPWFVNPTQIYEEFGKDFVDKPD